MGLPIQDVGVLFQKIMLLELRLLFGFLNILRLELDGIEFSPLFTNEDCP
jgi:hypothetical protein